MLFKFLGIALNFASGLGVVQALQPGENALLPPGRFSEGNRHFSFTISVTRDPDPGKSLSNG